MPNQRTVRLMKAVRIDSETERIDEEARDFWSTLLGALAERAGGPYFDMWHNNHEYRGVATLAPLASEATLYLAKQRNAADAPSRWVGITEGAPLGEPVHEPLFMLPLAGTPVVAVLGTSGAPTPTAVGRWLTQYMNAAQAGYSIELHPILLDDQREKLESALEATSFDITVDAATYEPRSRSEIEQGFAAAVRATGGAGTATMKLSLGRGNHRSGSTSMLAAVRGFFASGSLTRGRTRILSEDEDGGIRSELLDLVTHRFTHRVSTGGTETSLSVATALPALQEAAAVFRDTEEYQLIRQRALVD